ncbi:unnamed protein product, partial [Effrenium voratum]
SGGFLGAFVGRLLPAELTGGSGGSLCEIFGMVGLFASCFRFPLTPVVIVLEITGTESYNLILPVALSSFTALAVSNHLFPPLLEQLLEQDGIDLEAVAELAETADDEEFSQKASVELSDSQREEEDRPKRVDSVASVLHSATQTALGKLEMHLERSMLEVSSVDHTRRISLSSSRSPSSRRQSLGASFASAKNGLRRLSLRSESSTPRHEPASGRRASGPAHSGPSWRRRRSSGRKGALSASLAEMALAREALEARAAHDATPEDPKDPVAQYFSC